MHTVYSKKALLVSIILLLLGCLSIKDASAQWTAPYANNWISYGKPYVKIGITKKGVHRIAVASLPKEFQVIAPEKLQLWRRGKQVSLLSASKTEILFYALPNDGASDSLLYRPMSSRLNPYFSLYSDEGAYFLTNADEAGKRAPVINQAPDSKLTVLPAHDEVITSLFQTDYSLSAESSNRADFFNSFFELGASRTGKFQAVATTLTNAFTLTGQTSDLGNAWVKLLVHGRSNNTRNIEVYIGKDAQSLRKVGLISNAGFSGSEYTFALAPGDVDDAKKGIFTLKSVSAEKYDGFSLAYFSIGYRQLLNMNTAKTKEFRLSAAEATSAWSRLRIEGVTAGSRVLAMADDDNPAILEGSYENLMVPRTIGKKQRILVTSEVTDVAASKMKAMTFIPFSPKNTNYIIVTSENLADGANAYATYRASVAGGAFRPLVVKITDIYNQFNYGEPSPLAIRKFMAYMLNEGGTDKNLFLIGKSTTRVERMKRELADEVPTVGYPGSDILLVDGLAGAPRDVPAVPVGRFAAITNQNVLDYLEKVKEYEDNSDGEYGWRKNVLHLNGGKNVGEITQLRDLLADLVPNVETGVMGGKVTPYVKQRAMAEVESVNITQNVNTGVGLITYFGHGSPILTDLDMGYITDAARGYNNRGKYPMMYFNGCGVGNIFSGRFNLNPPNPTASDRITLSLDWMLAPKRGAIAVIANSFESFVSPSSNYLQQLYAAMFVNEKTYHMPIGKIQLEVAKVIVSKANDRYNVANVHQSLLQGDPVLKLVTLDKPDYAVNPVDGLTLYSESPDKTIENSDSIKVGIVVSNLGKNVSGLTIPVEITYLSKANSVTRELLVKSFPLSDTLNVSFANTKNIESVRISVDPKKSIVELNEQNNITMFSFNWDAIKGESLVSAKDLIAPLLTVKINSQIPRQDQTFTPNPEILVTATDDRRFSPDTSLVDIFIKRCGTDSCDFNKVEYSKSNIELRSVDETSFELKLSTTDLVPGVYEMLVNVRDSSGNVSPATYRVKFKVAEQDPSGPEMIVSPNPALSYAKFEIRNVSRAEVKSVRYIIYNSLGTVVRDFQAGLISLSPDNVWYWTPNLERSGLYTYKVILAGESGNTVKTLTGKLVLLR
ncbi:C25 family cysteine peptidase [Dyadobacter sp. CY261]|uniref:putative type IX secretion system sortase PorU2 n=1 Tax=Dyadobacter sp. CY261 TaxID=2907203 RepID=UPI001F3AEF41|nr:C25 family cysteine peptidase [Dyadobacter sp. CY261]MCF0071850.1 C25 family cysteine peptidase [Dyadobacter sp. CY261]